jgi:TIR domain
MGLKVFLSYAHDANAALVQRIGRDLEAVGHAPWIDTAEIKSGDDWRRTILDGLEDTDVTLAFLSRHAVREVGVCLDEIALALGVKYGNLATILVEPEQDVQPPVSVSHIQWLDMSGWAAQDDAWYQDRLRAILNLLADPETHRFRGEIEDLESRLHPITQAADIPPLIDGFVGREWVAAAVDTWRRSEPRRRVFRLTGGPGAGKSAFAAWLTHYQRGNVVGLNLCKWNDEDRSDPRRVLRTLAFLLATRLPDYRRRLLDRFRRHDPDGHELDRKGAAAMAHWLLAEPLALIDGGRRRDRCVLLIDALDETLCDNVSELADLLAELAPKLPAWLALLLTSRPDFPVAASLSHIAPFRLDAEGSAANTSDLLDYARRWLATPERTPAAADALIARVVAAAAGNFMYLCRLRAAVDEFGLDLNAPGPLPQGLSGLYRLWFRRQFPDAARYRTETAPLLEVLVAASRPVPVGLLRSMFGWDVPTEARLLDSLGSLFEERPDGVTPFHASLREWLTDRRQSGAEYVVDRARGSRLLADALWLRLVALLATPAGTLPDAFTLAELPMQMAPQDTADQLAHIAAAGGWEPVVGKLAISCVLCNKNSNGAAPSTGSACSTGWAPPWLEPDGRRGAGGMSKPAISG